MRNLKNQGPGGAFRPHIYKTWPSLWISDELIYLISHQKVTQLNSKPHFFLRYTWSVTITVTLLF